MSLGGEVLSEQNSEVFDNVKKLIFLLSNHKEFSKVLTLFDLILTMGKINSVYNDNSKHLLNLLSGVKEKYNDNYEIYAKKCIVCFPFNENNIGTFNQQLSTKEKITINGEISLLNLLANSLIYCKKDINNLVQFQGIKLEYIQENCHNLLKNYTNRLINTKMFEYTRLFLGDWGLTFLFCNCSMFIYDNRAQNYIQILGPNFKSIISKMISLPRIDRVGNNNFYFTKVFSSVQNSTYYTVSQYHNKNLTIPYDQFFMVERTKIYYCSNFNRKMGFFKSLKIKHEESLLEFEVIFGGTKGGHSQSKDKEKGAGRINSGNKESKVESFGDKNGNCGSKTKKKKKIMGGKKNLNETKSKITDKNTVKKKEEGLILKEEDQAMIIQQLNESPKKVKVIEENDAIKSPVSSNGNVVNSTNSANKFNFSSPKSTFSGSNKSCIKQSNQNKAKLNTIKQRIIECGDCFVVKTYNNLFGKVKEIIPQEIRINIILFLNQIFKKISEFDYSRVLFQCCPIIKDWKKLKNLIKINLQKIIQTKGDRKFLKKEYVETMNEQLKTLINSNISYDKIFKFTNKFLSFVLPHNLFGKKNAKVLYKKVVMFIEMNRFETFNKINLFENKEFSFKEMKWLNITNMSNKKYHEIGILLKNFIMKTLIHWVFNFILIQFFRSHFFITEKQGEHFRSIYYHKIIYDYIIKMCYTKYIYITKQYTISSKTEAFKVLANIDSAPGKVRLMPKPSTMRPITSFKRKTLGQNQNYLKNKLFDTQKIFKYIQNKMQSNMYNCAVFDYKEIMKRLIDFKMRVVKNDKESKMFVEEGKGNIKTNVGKYLNYITMDIEACYDNINIDLLNNFLELDDTISPTYITGILYVVIPKINKVKEANLFGANTLSRGGVNVKTDIKDCFDIKLLYMVCDLRDYIHMLDYIQKREEITYKNCLIYLDETIGLNYKTKENFIPPVRNIINNNFIKFNKTFLRQTNGIPQGLSVSSFLCNLFFYEIEKRLSFEIQNELNNKQSLLLRFMDDYLCLSNNEQNGYYFKDKSILLSKENKFNFNLKKLQSNLGEIILEKEKEKEENKTGEKENEKEFENKNEIRERLKNKSNKKVEHFQSFNFTLDKFVRKLSAENEREIDKINLEEYNKFTWNGIFFSVGDNNELSLVYDLKLTNNEDLDEYTKLINVNLPVIREGKDFTWLIKKINTVLFSGHPWIYFMSSINNKQVLEENF